MFANFGRHTFSADRPPINVGRCQNSMFANPPHTIDGSAMAHNRYQRTANCRFRSAGPTPGHRAVPLPNRARWASSRRPVPLADFRHILAIFANILLVVDGAYCTMARRKESARGRRLRQPVEEALHANVEAFLVLLFPEVHCQIDWSRGHESLIRSSSWWCARRRSGDSPPLANTLRLLTPALLIEWRG
jgi:hypothetical protein